jgi:hypothetical protein
MPFLRRKSESDDKQLMMQGGFPNAYGTLWREDKYIASERIANLDGRGLPVSLTAIPKRPLCGSDECSGRWTVPWRNRRRPVFEGQWGCSGRCVLAMARAAVRRERGDGLELENPVPHRHRVPLGLLMLAQGWITHPQLRKALEAQRESGSGRIGDWLQSECGLASEQIMRGLSMQWGCPVLTTEGFSPEAMALVMPRMFVEEFGLLPLRVAGSRILYVGFEERLDASAALAMEKMSGLKAESGLVEGTQFHAARSRLLESTSVEVRLETVSDKDILAGRMTAILEQQQPVASRLVRLHQYYWLRMWLEGGAAGKTGSLPGTGEDVMDRIFVIGAQG